MKSVVIFINEIIEEYETMTDIRNDEKTLKWRFEKINKNYLEPEYEVGPENEFLKIIDENLQGIDRYEGFLDKKCIDF